MAIGERTLILDFSDKWKIVFRWLSGNEQRLLILEGFNARYLTYNIIMDFP